MTTVNPQTDLDRWGKCFTCRREALLYDGRCDECWDDLEQARLEAGYEDWLSEQYRDHPEA